MGLLIYLVGFWPSTKTEPQFAFIGFSTNGLPRHREAWFIMTNKTTVPIQIIDVSVEIRSFAGHAPPLASRCGGVIGGPINWISPNAVVSFSDLVPTNATVWQMKAIYRRMGFTDRTRIMLQNMQFDSLANRIGPLEPLEYVLGPEMKQN